MVLRCSVEVPTLVAKQDTHHGPAESFCPVALVWQLETLHRDQCFDIAKSQRDLLLQGHDDASLRFLEREFKESKQYVTSFTEATEDL